MATSQAGMQFKSEFKTPKAKIKTNEKAARQIALASMVKGVQAGASQVESYLPSLLDQALESNVWSWPRSTLRKNGQTAGGTRDIVDSGRLKSSKKITTKFLQTKTTFNITYTAPYAALVHYGGYITPYGDVTRAPVYVPGRPWVQGVLEGNVNGINYIQIDEIMDESIESEWNAAR